MRPGCGAPLLIRSVVVIVLSQHTGAQANMPDLQHLPPASHTLLPLAPVISCDVSVPSVTAGQSVEVTTRVIQGDAAGLKYTFETSAGKFTVAGANASTARLDTKGVMVGEINVTCVVVDAYGRKVSHGKMIRLSAQHLPSAAKGPPNAKKGPDVEQAAPPPPPPAPAPVTEPQSGAPPLTKAASPPARQRPRQGPTGSPRPGTLTAAGTASRDGRPVADPGANEYAEGLAIQKWEKELKTGKIEYNLPTKMSLPDATTVSVVVHGYEDVSGPAPAGAQSAALKVSQRMRVLLSAEENPNEFKIERDGTEDVQLVPIDGTARWQWKVTPKEPAKDQRLTIRALLVYPNDPNKAAVEITSYTAEVSVQVGSVWEWAKYLFWNDPVGLVKYLLPGGAGFAFVAGLVVWWWKRRHPEKMIGNKD
jgi:hypothetical protein